jgi:hypothetical protein
VVEQPPIVQGDAGRPRRISRRRVKVVALVYAVVLSTAAFGWQVWQSWERRPALLVEGPQSIAIVNDNGRYRPVETRLQFVNRSARAVTIYRVEAELFGPFGSSTHADWKPVAGATTTLPLRVEDGSVILWTRTDAVEFDRAPALEDRYFYGTLSVMLSTTAGTIEQSLPVTISYDVIEPEP